jgi:DeoR family transcriptional regulator, fructose operon transcriptional repressor
MKPYSRHRLILDKIGDRDAVSIDELIAATGASPSTIRRDIRVLEEAGQVVSLRGGAIRLDNRFTELPAATKSLLNQPEKTAIARTAASLVKDGDTIYLDSGTTATSLLEHLKGTRVHVITSNTQIFSMPLSPTIDITVLGGDYLPDLGSIVGSLTDRMLNDLFFDKAFVGANGISRSAGITTFDIREANKKRLAHEHSQETFVLADSSKLGQVSLCRAFDLIDATVITDRYAEVLQGARDFILAPVEGSQDEKKPQLLNEPSIGTIGDSSDNAPSPAQSVGSP